MSDKYVSPYPAATRREMLRVYATLALLVPLPALPLAWPSLDRLWHAADERHLVMERVAFLTIPDSDTPGADHTGVARFVELALRHGLDGTRDAAGSVAIPATELADDGHESDAAHRLLKPVKRALDAGANGDFLRAPAEAQEAALVALDTQAFAPGNDDHPWHKIKDLILTGYYTSETGAAKELQYELVPGRWDADLPLPADGRAFSSDWTAVDFG